MTSRKASEERMSREYTKVKSKRNLWEQLERERRSCSDASDSDKCLSINGAILAS